MILQCLFLLLSIIAYNNAPHYMDRNFLGLMLILAIISIVHVYSIKEYNKNLKGQYIRHSFIFLVGYIVVFYQYIIDYIIGFIEIEDVQSLIWYDETVVAKCMCMANMALNMFLIGYLYVKKSVQSPIKREGIYKFRNTIAIYYFSIILIAIYVITIDKNYLFNGYGKNYSMGDVAFHVSIWIQGILTAYVVIESYIAKGTNSLLTFRDYLSKFHRPLILCLIMTVLILMSGRRTEALRFILLLCISYVYIRNIKLNLRKLIIPFIFTSVVMASIIFIRTGAASNINEAIGQLSATPSISPLTQELAFNISSLHIAVSNVPTLFPYYYGISVILGLTNLIPGLQPFILNNFSIPILMRGSSYLICYAVFGEFRYYSLGTSILADSYINFGMVGIIIVPLLLGIVLRTLEDVTFADIKRNPYLIGISFCFFTNLLYMCRGNITSPLASLSYVLLFIFLFGKRHLIKK